MSMGILDILAFLGSGQRYADGERITKWIDLNPEWKFMAIMGTIVAVLSIPFFILGLMDSL
jgi:hypothetical protein